MNHQENPNKPSPKNGKLKSFGIYFAVAITLTAVAVGTVANRFQKADKPLPKQDAHTQKSEAPIKKSGQDRIWEESPLDKSFESLVTPKVPTDKPSGTSLNGQVTEALPQTPQPSSTEKKEVTQVKESAKSELSEEVNIGEPTVQEVENAVDEVPFSSGEEPQEPVLGVSYNGFIKPVSGYIQKEYSVEMPVYSATMYDYRTHAGIDIACDIGTPVKAVSGGVIKDIYEDALYGTTVVMEHADGVCSVYRNISKDLPVTTKIGAVLATGETVAGVGENCLCESAEVPHLHFEMTKDGKSVNPLDYIPQF